MLAVHSQSKTKSPQGTVAAKPQVIMVATDGTSQSEPAIAFAIAFAKRSTLDVRVVSIVDHSPMPWGGADRTVIAEYERSLQKEALEKAKLQVSSSGAANWPVEIQTGDPATRISALATEANASLVVVGLGGHGAAARLFGSETALRLVRVSQTPVLAVAPKYRDAPHRIMVAMDFSEASIEAARLSLELADKNATMVLAYVVPWDRKEYIPEDWFRSHESSVGAELTRVAHWLDDGRKFRISHRILYGKSASSLLAYADELGADLIVAGSHGRTLLGRALTGQTVSKLIRGARCSVLVLPAAAAFKPHGRPRTEDVAAGGKEWAATLDEFSKRNVGRRGRLEVDDADLGAQVEMSGYCFLGATYEPHNRRATLMFGAMGVAGPHLERGISDVKSVDILRGKPDKPDAALSISHEGGQTLLVFGDADRKATHNDSEHA